MPWYRGDYLRVTIGWPPLARLVYFELLGAQWDNGVLPADRERLRGLVQLNGRQFDAAWRHCCEHFPEVENGRANYQLEIARGESIAVKKSRSRAARTAARARWNGGDSGPGR
jgi:hypothetical protein